MTSLATQAAEYASAMASAYAMDWHTWPIDIAATWSNNAMVLAWRVRGKSTARFSALAWAETAARLMNGEY